MVSLLWLACAACGFFVSRPYLQKAAFLKGFRDPKSHLKWEPTCNPWPLPAPADEAYAYALQVMKIAPPGLARPNGWFVARFHSGWMSTSEYDLDERPRLLTLRNFVVGQSAPGDSFELEALDYFLALRPDSFPRIELREFRPAMAHVGYYVDEAGNLTMQKF
jgi:hypothetical protein